MMHSNNLGGGGIRSKLTAVVAALAMLGTSAIAGTAAAQDVVSADGSETRTYSATATADDGSLIDVSVDAPSGALPDGVISLKGLSAGYYTVIETATNQDAGYSDQFLPTFTVHVGEDGTAALATRDSMGLVTTEESGIQVKNIKSITQLPITGAAGITAFIILGLLIAGAGVTVYMKSRNVRRMMRA